MDTEDTRKESEAPEEGTDDEDDEVTGQETEDEDPVKEAISRAIEAERERIRQEAETAAEARYREQLEEERKAQQAAMQNARLQNAFGDTVKEIRNGLKKLKVRSADGKEIDVELADDFIEEMVVKPLNNYNMSGRTGFSLEMSQKLLENALKVVPEAERENFVKKAHNKSLDEWLATLAETYAPHSSWAKTQQKEREAAIAAAEARAAAKKSPAGAPKVPESGSGGGRKVDLTTAGGLSRALRDGAITQDKFRELWPKVTRPAGL